MTKLMGTARAWVQAIGTSSARFFMDTRAAALIYVTLTLPVIVGTALLAIDASRYSSLHTSLQKAADALAIAGAGELDRAPGAIARANMAIQNMVANDRVFSTSGASIDLTTEIAVRFLDDLPPKDSDLITATYEVDLTNLPEADATARFVEVTVNPSNFSTIFPASYLGGSNTATTQAVAVAGNDSVVCDLMPLFICNPYERDDNVNTKEINALKTAASTQAGRRRQILMKAGPGNGGSYFPGDYGFLDMGSGAQSLAQALAYDRPEVCVLQTGVTTETGQKAGPVENAINVRFGLYPNGGALSNNADPKLRPAKNVRKGQLQNVNKQCVDYQPFPADHPNPGDAPKSVPLPRDTCFADATPCPSVAPFANVSGRIGNGSYDLDAYWATNYNGAAVPAGLSSNPATLSTRYEVYLEEIRIDQHLVASPNVNPSDPNDPGGETGYPTQNTCYAGSTTDLTDEPDRRVINAAIINCNAYAISEDGFNNSPSGKLTDVPVAAFAEFFVTEPMDNPPGGGSIGERAIWAEIVRVLQPGTGGNGNSIDMVQLYR